MAWQIHHKRGRLRQRWEPISELNNDNKKWLEKNIHNLRAICHVSHYCWLRYPPPGNRWVFSNDNLSLNEETKRFFAWMLDTIRNKSKKRHQILADKKISLMSEYIRD